MHLTPDRDTDTKPTSEIRVIYRKTANIVYNSTHLVHYKND